MDERTLNDLLECSVCLERLDTTSKVLPCQHTFCYNCLEVIVSSHTVLHCPECRILVDTKIENLPPNVLLMRILEGMKNTTNIRSFHSNGTEHSKISEATSCQPTNNNNDNNSKQSTHLIQHTKGSSNVRGPNVIDQQQKRTAAANHENVPKTTTEQLTVVEQCNENQFGDIKLQFNAHQQHKEQSKVQNAITKTNLSAIPHAKALYDFESNVPGDLSFRTGDKVILHRYIDVNWLEGECHGRGGVREGVFPINYVRIIVPLPHPQCKALYDFRMESNEEEGCLAFKKGDIINVLRRIDANWAEGRIDDTFNIGIFPIAFVEMNSLAKQLMDTSVIYNNCVIGQRNVPPAPTEHKHHGGFHSEMSQLQTTKALTSSHCTNTNNNGNYNNSSTISNGAMKNQNFTLSSEVLLTKDKQESLRSTCSILDACHKKSKRNLIAKDIQTNSKAKILDQKHPREISVNNKFSNGKSNQLQNKNSQTLNKFIALYPYKPQKPDELELKKGSIYYVKGRCQDGWFRGVSRSQKSGVFPGNYVAPLENVNDHSNGRKINGQPALNAGSIGFASGTLSCNSTTADKNSLLNIPELPPRSKDSTPPSNSTWTNPIGQHVEAIFGKSQSSSTVNLIKRITTLKTNHKHQPMSPSYSMDNPVFEDNTIGFMETRSPLSKQNAIQTSQAGVNTLHVRSGSCPSQLLQSLPADVSLGLTATTNSSKSEMFGSHVGLQSGLNVNQVNNAESLSLQSTSSSHHRKSQSLTLSTETGNQNRRKSYTHNEKFKCVVSYPPHSDFELELAFGDIVYVHKKRDNGWFKGTHARSGKVGLFPSSFVEPLQND